VIDVVADSREDLFKSLDGRTVSVGGQVRTLSFSSYEILKINKPIQASIYEVISNPQLATILLLLGIYLLIFGLTSPGMLAETAGAICLVLALAGLGVIGVNYLGLVLVVLGVIFLVAEIMTPTYGILGAASVICVTLGALILFQEPLMPRSFYETFPRLIGGIAIGMASIMTFLIIKISKLRKKESRVGEVVGEEGEVIEFKHGKGMAKVRGELWKIECDEELTEGDRILVIQRDGLKLKVKKVEENAGGRAEK
jgi:membrane-bound serine protease (ClpP class)